MSQVASEMNDPVYGQMIPRRLHESSPRDKPRSRGNSATSFNSVAGARQTPNPPSSGVSLHHPRRPEPPCVMCGQSHRLWYCDKFKNLKPNQLRLDIVKQYKLCENCLMGNHETSKCRKNSVCSVNGCGKRHTKFIHVDDVVNQNEGNENDNTVKVASVFSDSQVYMPIVEVRVNDCYTTYALLDTASTNSFCSKNLVGLLNISGKAQSNNLNTLCGSESKMSEVVSLEVKSVDNTEALYMSNVYVVTDIPTGTSQVNVDKYPHLQDLTLPGVKSGVSVDVLIGQDNAEALVPLEIRRGSRNEPFAIRTMFGWCLNGSTGITYKIPGNRVLSHFISTTNINSIEEQVSKLWKVENDVNYSQDIAVSQEDKQVLNMWENEIKLVDGHYELPIPWRDPCAPIPNNVSLATHRLQSLRKSLAKKGLIERYDSEIQKLLRSNYAEEVPQN